MKKITISPQVANILERAHITDNRLVLPEQLDRTSYVAVNKVIEALGGKWNKSSKAHLFPLNVGNLIADTLENGFATNTKDVLNQFYTPAPLADYLVSQIHLEAGMTVLEPSAGHGALTSAIYRAQPYCKITAIEIDAAAHGYLNDMVCTDFLDWSTKNEPARFDVVVMNPPFSEQRDARHVLAAWRHVKEGGALASICGSGISFRDTAYSIAVRNIVSKFGVIEHLPENSFAPQTNVNTVMLVLKKA